jgi:hypothetical protein
MGESPSRRLRAGRAIRHNRTLCAIGSSLLTQCVAWPVDGAVRNRKHPR